MAVIDGNNGLYSAGVDANGNVYVILKNSDGTVFSGFKEPCLITNGVLSESSLALGTTYTQPVGTRVSVDGYNTVTFIIKSSGTGTAPILFKLYGSYDGTNWFTKYIHESFIQSPQSGTMKEAFVQIQTQIPFLRCSITTDNVLAPTSVVVDTIVGNSFSTGESHESINIYGSVIEGSHEARGMYSVHFTGVGVATASLQYFAIFNPSTSISNIRIDEIKMEQLFTSGTSTTSKRNIEMTSITSLSGGTIVTPVPFDPSYPIPFFSCVNNTTAITVGGASNPITSFLCNNSNGGSVTVRDIIFSKEKAIIIPPGYGISFGTSTVALTTNDSFAITLSISEVA